MSTEKIEKMIRWLDEHAFWELDKPDAMGTAARLYTASDMLRTSIGLSVRNTVIIEEACNSFESYYGYKLDI
jgi:hypothetical protein